MCVKSSSSPSSPYYCNHCHQMITMLTLAVPFEGHIYCNENCLLRELNANGIEREVYLETDDGY